LNKKLIWCAACSTSRSDSYQTNIALPLRSP